MAFALVVLALAMMGAGGYAAWTGYDIIQMERGWAFFIAGSVVTTGGVILLGIAAAVGRLGRLRKELAQRLAAPSATAGRSAAASAAGPRIEPSFPIAPPPIPSQAAADSLLEGGPSAPPTVDPAILQGAPEFLMRRRGSRASDAPAPTFRVPPPDMERPVERRTAAANEPEENAPFASGDPVVPEFDGGPVATGTAAPPAPTAPPRDEPPTIVGTYNSGGNRYVMYSDGSIAADTPRGEFRFGSLDELKQFIAAGGEKG